MNKMILVPMACLALLSGCASGQMRKVENSSEANQKMLREADMRLQKLEGNVASLDSRVAQLSNRAYEVRTRAGGKTNMTVVPILPAPATATAPLSQQSLASGVNAVPVAPASGQAAPVSATLAPAAPALPPPPSGQAGLAAKNAAAPSDAPKGKAIDPAAPPMSLSGKNDKASPASGQASAQASAQAPTAGAYGQLGQGPTAGPSGQLTAAASTAANSGNLALPPTEMVTPAPSPAAATPSPATAAAAAGGRGKNNAAVPVPALPATGLDLPPEHPGLPPVDAPAPGAARQAEKKADKKAAGQTENPTPLAEAAAPAATLGAPAGKNTKAAALPKPGKGEDAAYKAALQVTLSGRPAEGIQRFREFLQQYPDGRYAANADYWIGEGYYAQGNIKEALAQFQTVNAKYPRHHKNADALLKAGMCFSRLGDKESATREYQNVLSNFPNSEAARMVRSRGLTR